MVIIEAADREGNTSFRDLYYKCPICGTERDTYEAAKTCLAECAEEEYGLPKQYERIDEEGTEICLD